MKILYGIHTTGNGHIARAFALLPELKKHAEVDVLVSGLPNRLQEELLPKYRKIGVTIDFNKKGNVSIAKSLKNVKFLRFIKEVVTLDLTEYDLIVSDFEPTTSWAARIQNKKSIGMGNQYVYLNKNFRKAYGISIAIEDVIKIFAGCQKNLAISYTKTADEFYTPIIREDIRQVAVTKGDHFTIYLNTHKTSRLVKHFHKLKEYKFELFTSEVKKEKKSKNITLKPINNKNFVKSLANSKGFITGGGFESTSEGLFLGKKMLVIPINNFEQRTNAKMLNNLGVKSIKKIDKNFENEVRDWINNWEPIKMNYPNVKKQIVQDILEFGAQPMKEGLGLPPLKKLNELKKAFKNFSFN